MFPSMCMDGRGAQRSVEERRLAENDVCLWLLIPFLAHTNDFVIDFGTKELFVVSYRMDRLSELFQARNFVNKSIGIAAHCDLYGLWGGLAGKY